ncbi:MAG: SGNH/GDSL hydrolase family protein [Bacteroidota bacterium]
MQNDKSSPEVPVTVPKDTAKKAADTTKKPVNPPVVRPPDPNQGKHINYLALGDSYTIGESVAYEQNFPNQLQAQLNVAGLVVNPPTIIARTGWTTSELISAIESSGVINKFNFVTLLIGVNNQYRGESQETYRKEFRQLLQTAINYADKDKSHVFVISIPDWGVTPFARNSGKNQKAVAEEIDAFNAINKEETTILGVSYTDITPGSRLALTDNTLTAPDGLHPSAKMYKNWVSLLVPEITKSFKQN